MDQWDRFEIPWPFAHAVLVVGEPIVVPAKAGDAELEQARLQLETAMNALMAEAARRLNFSKAVEQKEGQRTQGQ